DKFHEVLKECELQDLGYSGDIYTWRNKQRNVQGYIRERLDRAVANTSWRCHFPLVHVVNGDPRHSDHRLVIISTERKLGGDRGGEKPFMFNASWLEEVSMRKVVKQNWELGKEEGA